MSDAASDEGIRRGARRLLEAHGTATLATTDGATPWAAAVFYASDPGLNLYFVSDPTTRHGRDLAACGEAAAAVHADCTAWSEVRGVQLRGRVGVLEGQAREAALAVYLAKFADVRRLFEQPADAVEATIARRLQAASVYRLSPVWLRVIDNRLGFGFRRELALE